MSRWGRRWSLDWATRQEVGAVAHTKRVGGRYVSATTVRHEHRGIRMRSGYETNYAKFLDFLGIPWEYEPRLFIFEPIVTGVRAFRPDFYLPRANEFHECKGFMDQKSRTKLKRMAKYFPEIKLVLIDKAFFASVERQRLCKLIPGWTCRHTTGGRS